MSETVVFYGGQVKALGDNDGRVGGYLVRFDDDGQARDLDGEYFTSKTYLGSRDGDGLDTMFHHGMPIRAERDGQTVEFTEFSERVFAPMKTTRDDVGIWAETVLNMADEYEKAVYELAKQGKLGWSSGAAGHTVRIAGDGQIKRWVIAEGSLTPTPAEPRNRAINMKALDESVTIKLVINSDDDEPEAQAEDVIASPSADESDNADNKNSMSEIEVIGEVGMSDNNTQQSAPQEDIQAMKAQLQAQQGQIDDMSKGINQLLEMAQTPKVNHNKNLPGGALVSETGGTSDPNVKSVSDLLVAVLRGDTKRLYEHYNKTQRISSGADGGFLVRDETLDMLDLGLSMASGLTQLVRTIPVNSFSGGLPIADYSVSVSGGDGQSASAANVNSQARAEGGSYTEETAKFEYLRWDIQGATTSGVFKVTQEQMMAAPTIEALVRQFIQEDDRNKREHYVLQGSGVNQPLGFLNWAGIIGVNEDTDNTFAYADSTEMLGKLLMGNPNARPAWVISPSAVGDFASFNYGSAAAIKPIQGALPLILHGYPVFVSQHVPAQGTDGYVTLLDLSSYIMFDYGGLMVRVSEHRYADEGKIGIFFDRYYDGQPALTSSVTLADGTLTQSIAVKLNNLS